VPAALLASCQAPVPQPMLTNEQLAQAYLEMRDSFDACSERHRQLARAVTLAKDKP